MCPEQKFERVSAQQRVILTPRVLGVANQETVKLSRCFARVLNFWLDYPDRTTKLGIGTEHCVVHRGLSVRKCLQQLCSNCAL